MNKMNKMNSVARHLGKISCRLFGHSFTEYFDSMIWNPETKALDRIKRTVVKCRWCGEERSCIN